jgi:hypothetical protein
MKCSPEAESDRLKAVMDTVGNVTVFLSEGADVDTAEKWGSDKALAVLNGQASTVAAAIRRKATTLGLDPRSRHNADRCADYLLAERDYLNYPQALRGRAGRSRPASSKAPADIW